MNAVVEQFRMPLLQRLNVLAGEWEGSLAETRRVTTATSDGAVHLVFQWTHARRWLEFILAFPAGNGAMQTLSAMIGATPNDDRYRAVAFDSAGGIDEYDGTWCDERRLEFVAPSGARLTFELCDDGLRFDACFPRDPLLRPARASCVAWRTMM